MARIDPPSIREIDPDVPPEDGQGLEAEPVPLPQVVGAVGVPGNVTVTVVVLGTVSVAVLVTSEEIVSVTVVG